MEGFWREKAARELDKKDLLNWLSVHNALALQQHCDSTRSILFPE